MKLKLPMRTWYYFFAQSINLTTAVMSVSMAASIGATLAPEPNLSTVPYGFQFLFVMLSTWPAAYLMKRLGRKKSFLLSSIPLFTSGITGYISIEQNIFPLLIISHGLLGIYIAFANFNRFAATDGLENILKPKAISLVVAGGVIAAIVGPLLTSNLREMPGFSEFSVCYAMFSVLAIISIFIHGLIKEEIVYQEGVITYYSSQEGVWKLIFENKFILSAILIAALGYGIMNLLMIQTSLYMANLHMDFSDVSHAIQWHVLAMFAPSFFTGILIKKLGIYFIAACGIILLLLSSVINLIGNNYNFLMLALIFLGFGWNFTYVGGSSLLAQETEGKKVAIPVQGLNDLCISVMATLGAFMPAVLLAHMGWGGTNFFVIIICLMLLFFTLYIFRKQKRDSDERRIS